jgi:mono/diheme cytochrome c family protein
MQRLVCLIPILFALAPAAALAQGDPAEKSGGVAVSDVQAQRGETAFRANCTTCHTVKQFVTPEFAKTWTDRPVFELFEQLRTTMPQDNPGKLTRQQYIDLVTYLFKSNGAASGEQELAPDDNALKQAKVRLKTGS